MTDKMIENPILRGFNPDPSILRVGEDYYIVNSTFEWFPGYQIHHSCDLRNWELCSRPLTRKSQLDMAGVPDSGGVWAPCLSHHNGVFYLLYSNVRSFEGPFKDTPNYVVSSADIRGDAWSEPTFLNSSGFDASFFHDDDERTWLLNMVVDHRHDRFFGGIVLQEFDREQSKLVGKIHHIFSGVLGRTEGPHIYKRNGWYYLIVAEGGTGYEHAMTMARSRTLTGPYEIHPENPVISARGVPDNYLQKAGHGDLVETQNGEWYAVFLASRPLTRPFGRCTLGRETAIEKMVWRGDGWLYMAAGGCVPRRYVEAPSIPARSFPSRPSRTEFDDAALPIDFQSLRVPMTEDWMNLTARAGHLRLYGRQSLGSCFEQSLVARRVQARHIEASTCLEFGPDNFQQMAGLVCYYNTYHYHYLYVHGDDLGADTGRKFLNILTNDKYRPSEPVAQPLELTGADRIYLKAEIDGARLQFSYSLRDNQWHSFGPALDASILSDDYVEDGAVRFRPCFTGAFVGLCCQDLSGQFLYADFDWFEYREIG